MEKFRGYLHFLARLNLPSKLRGKVDPSDVVQQTLLEAHQSRALFRGTTLEEEAAWLRRILACNLANLERDYRREKRNIARERSLEARVNGSSVQLSNWLAREQRTPSGLASAREEGLRLAQAIVALPAEEQDVLLLRHFEGLTFEVIAKKIGVSETQAARLLRRGLNAIKHALGDAP